jgi:hypothetical protein
MVTTSRAEIVTHFTAEDLDSVADLIIEKASNAFLDKALACRLYTIDARSLLNALARAERLGYDAGDIIEDNPVPRRDEQVIPGQPPVGVGPNPNKHGSPPQPGHPGYYKPHPQHEPAPQPQDTYPVMPRGPPPVPHAAPVPQCERCGRAFPAQSAYDHVSKQPICSVPEITC